MSVILVEAGGVSVTALFPGVWAWLVPLLTWYWVPLTRPQLRAFSSAVMQPCPSLHTSAPWGPPVALRSPREQLRDPWPVSLTLCEMPRGCWDISAVLTCIRNQSLPRSLALWVNFFAEPQISTRWLTVRQKGAPTSNTRCHCCQVEKPKKKTSCFCFMTLQFWKMFAGFIFILRDTGKWGCGRKW